MPASCRGQVLPRLAATEAWVRLRMDDRHTTATTTGLGHRRLAMAGAAGTVGLHPEAPMDGTTITEPREAAPRPRVVATPMPVSLRPVGRLGMGRAASRYPQIGNARSPGFSLSE